MKPEAGLIIAGAGLVLYVAHLLLLKHFYSHTFSERPPNAWDQVLQNYRGTISWCLQEGTLPRWVPKMGSMGVLMVTVGIVWAVVFFIF